jgi:hypothetical protein
MRKHPKIFGTIVLPHSWKKTSHCYTYALDNGAFKSWLNKTPWDKNAFYALLERSRDWKAADFVVLPDIIGGGLKSLRLSLEHLDRVKSYDYPVYLPIQEGIPVNRIHDICDDIDGVFLGGETMQFKRKIGPKLSELSDELGLKFHIGKIGTIKNIEWAKEIGADSIDSSSVARNKTWNVLDILVN